MESEDSPEEAGAVVTRADPETISKQRNLDPIASGATRDMPVPVAPAPEPLAESTKAEINRLHGEICEAARTSIGKAIRIGELLTQTRLTLKHGEWLPWLKENVGFSRQTAEDANAQQQWWHEYQVRAERKLGEALISARPGASAIAEIRDRRLYRQTYASFAEYCEVKLGMSESRINKLLSIILV
jgi:Protein of unknown function (DUF3102)